MNQLSLDEFLRLSRKGNLIPVWKQVSADLETPVSAYLKLAGGDQYSFLLESVEGAEKFSRFSFIASNPELVVRCKGPYFEVLRKIKGKTIKKTVPLKESPLAVLRDIMKDYQAVDVPELPSFYGGLVGYLAYDCVRFFERLPERAADDLKLDDLVMMLAKTLVIFDHRHHCLKLVSNVHCDAKATKAALTAKYHAALKAIEHLARRLRQPLKEKVNKPTKAALTVKSNCSKSEFADKVAKAKQHIHDGDIIQVVLSQRFSVPIKTQPFNIYRSLRGVNPSPYMFYLNLDGLQLAGASPELLVRCEGGVVQTRPIAGTRPRGQGETEDLALEKELLADPKEKAEHIMLVDLGRNDLGRVSEQGSVQLSEFMAVERYSHVMHIVSNVRGTLRRDKDALDVLQAAFPAGTVSGAPKIRAMQIIEDLEGQKRGPYAGAVGYFSFSKNLDMCITIRTIVVRAGKAYVQAGAGIVADSDPAKEYEETVNKAKAQIKAIQLAHGQN